MKRIYFKKILIMYSALLFVLTIIFSSVFFMNVNKNEKVRLKEQNLTLLTDYISSQENNYAGLIKSCDKVSNLNTVATYAISSGSDYYRRMSLLMDDLAKMSGAGQKTIYMVQKQNDDTCVTNIQSASIKDQLFLMDVDEKIYNQTVSSFQKSDLQNFKFIFTDMGTLYMTSKTFGNSRVIVAAFTFWDSIVKPYSEGTYASFIIDDPEIIDLRTEKNMTEDYETLKSAEINRTEIVENNGGQYTYFYRHSKYMNLMYFLKTDATALNAFSAVMDFLPFIVITFALSFIAILYISKKMYAPIDKLVSIFTDMQDSENSDEAMGSDIEYLAKQVSRIRYENQDLTKAIEENQQISKSRLISSLLSGNYDTAGIMPDLLQFNLQWMDAVNYIVMADMVYERPEDAKEIDENVFTIIKERLEQTNRVEYVRASDHKNYYIINSDNLENLESLLANIITVIETAFGLSVVFYVSKRSKSLENIHYSTMTIEKVFENSLTVGRKSIYDFRDVKQSNHHTAIYPVSIENKLLQSIENGNSTELENILTYIFNEYVVREFENKPSRDLLIYAFINTINRCAERFSVSIADIIGEDTSMYRLISSSASPVEFKKIVSEILNEICTSVESNKDRRDDEMKVQIEKYIEKNIASDISLISIADYFKLTPNYMSSIFKNVIGENFKDYTSRYRFELSTQILRENPNITLSELSNKVGINSIATLIRLFKKYSGCSPTQYVQKYLD